MKDRLIGFKELAKFWNEGIFFRSSRYCIHYGKNARERYSLNGMREFFYDTLRRFGKGEIVTKKRKEIKEYICYGRS